MKSLLFLTICYKQEVKMHTAYTLKYNTKIFHYIRLDKTNKVKQTQIKY